MKYSTAYWTEKRKSGLATYLFFDGVLKAGGAFAVMMQIVGVIFFRDDTQTVGQYLSSSTSWLTFFLNATLFGSIVGYITWRNNEKEFRAANAHANEAQN